MQYGAATAGAATADAATQTVRQKKIFSLCHRNESHFTMESIDPFPPISFLISFRGGECNAVRKDVASFNWTNNKLADFKRKRESMERLNFERGNNNIIFIHHYIFIFSPNAIIN